MDLKFDPKSPKYELITTPKKVEQSLKMLEKEKMLGVDVESTHTDPYIAQMLLIQVASAETCYIFDVRKLDIKKIPKLKQILEDKSKVKLLQNAKFDYEMLKVHYGIVLNNIYDTMLAEQVLTSGLNKFHNLKSISDRYLGEEVIDKSLQESFINLSAKRITEDQLKYAARDALVLFPLFEEQSKLLKKENLVNIAKLEFAVAPVVAEMELKGVHLDTKKWMEIINRLKKRRDEIAKEFQEEIRPYYEFSQSDLFGNMADAININSQVQLMDLFNNKLGLGLPSTSDGFLARVNNPIVKLLRDYRGYAKIVSTYGEKLLSKISKKTGRLHPDYLQLKTATGRFACNNPNLQNIPRNSKEAPFRECFNPEPGYKLVVADYSQFEMRILAELSGDKNMRKAFEKDLDAHSYTASLMFGKPYSDDFKKKYPDLRQISKPIGFGLMYGMGAQALVSQIYMETGKEVTLSESEDLIRRYFKSYPSVKRFLERRSHQATLKGWSITPAGRKRWYKLPDKIDPNYNRAMAAIRREARNHPIQGTNADAIKYALYFVHEKMDKMNIDGSIILTVHDEIVCEIRKDQAEDFAPVLEGEMRRAGELFLKKVPAKTDSSVGDVWEH